MLPLEVVKLTALMASTCGSPEIRIGLIDGPVATQHADLASDHIRQVPGSKGIACVHATSMACLHGTFVAGILCANRNSLAPAICPNCTLLVRPIFPETDAGREGMPIATPLALAAAIIECIDEGAQIINLSLGLAQPSTRGEQVLEQALDHAVRHGVILVAAAGNQGTVGSSAITRHPWVVPVVACDLRGRPMNETNLSGSIGSRGLSAPGEGIVSLGSTGQSFAFQGTSVSVPFVTGAIALLWSEFPTATAGQIKFAITQTHTSRRASIVPPLLDADAAYHLLLAATTRRRSA